MLFRNQNGVVDFIFIAVFLLILVVGGFVVLQLRNTDETVSKSSINSENSSSYVPIDDNQSAEEELSTEKDQAQSDPQAKIDNQEQSVMENANETVSSNLVACNYSQFTVFEPAVTTQNTLVYESTYDESYSPTSNVITELSAGENILDACNLGNGYAYVVGFTNQLSYNFGLIDINQITSQ